MSDTITTQTSNRAVSPVIAVILMVAVTVALSSIVGMVVLDMGMGSTDDQSDAGFRINEQSDGVHITLISATGAVDVQKNGHTIHTFGRNDVGEHIVVTGYEDGDTISLVSNGSSGDDRILQQYHTETTVTETVFADSFEDGDFTSNWDDTSEADASPTMTDTAASAGTYALDMYSRPGDSTINTVQTHNQFPTNRSFKTDVYKYADDGDKNHWRVSLDDADSGDSISVRSSGYHGGLEVFEEVSGTSYQTSLRGEFTQDTWHTLRIEIVDASTVSVTVDGETTEVATNTDWTGQEVTLSLLSNGWNGGGDMGVYYDDVTIESTD